MSSKPQGPFFCEELSKKVNDKLDKIKVMAELAIERLNQESWDTNNYKSTRKLKKTLYKVRDVENRKEKKERIQYYIERRQAKFAKDTNGRLAEEENPTKERKETNPFTRQRWQEGEEKCVYMEYDKWGRVVESKSNEVVIAHWERKGDKLRRCRGCTKNIKKKGCCYFKYQKDLLSGVIVDRKKKIHAEISELLGSQMQQIGNCRGTVENIQRIKTSENSHSKNRCSKDREERRRNKDKNIVGD
ncbi:16149_t:CDS:2 [Gigaspora rosea]|nr:16149_t:CDS:2 [Gigaspora rosea]